MALISEADAVPLLSVGKTGASIPVTSCYELFPIVPYDSVRYEEEMSVNVYSVHHRSNKGHKANKLLPY